jgi:uncharacterized protein (DUF433 family)
MPRTSRSQPVIHSDPEILDGTPVFVGTRVPAQALLDYLERGRPLDEFLDDFPSVSRDQAVAALHLAGELLLERATVA